MTGLPFTHDDGGRAAAGYRGETGDCVTRAIAIATGLPYRDVYHGLHNAAHALGLTGRAASPRTGMPRKVYEPYMLALGWQWTPTMHIGAGTTVHLADGELPAGVLVVRLSRHITAVLDGVVHDTHNPTRDGTRAVYGYFAPAA